MFRSTERIEPDWPHYETKAMCQAMLDDEVVDVLSLGRVIYQVSDPGKIYLRNQPGEWYVFIRRNGKIERIPQGILQPIEEART